jgi:hypothetical protein
MSQSSSQTVLNTSNPFLDSDIPDSEEIYEPTPFGISAITNVDHLMNDLFQGVEQMLERGVLPAELYEEPAPAPPVAPFVMPSFILSPSPEPESTAPRAPHPASPIFQDSLLDDPDLEELLVMEQGLKAKPKRGSGNVLLSAVVATLMLTGGLFVGFKYRLWTLIPGLTTPEQMTATQTVSPEAAPKDQQFLNYVGRSLNRIDRTASRSTPAPGTVATLPPALPSASPTVVDRYVPVYQQPPLFGSFTSKPGASAPVPSVATAPPAPPVAQPRAASPRAAAPRAATPRVAAALPAPIPVAPSPVAIPSTAALTPNFDPAETHSLSGLLELGDRSAALLQVNGVPQRIEVGNKIGASGWQIMSISNQAAIIQRNGEVRSVYVGQQF